MGYAKRNLHDVEDSAAKHGFGDHQEARFPTGELGAVATGLTHLRVKPGRREAFAHRHREAEEVIVVLSGHGRVRLDDDIVDLAPLDAVRVSPSTARMLEASADAPLEVLVFGPHVSGDAELLQDFWTD